VEEDTEELSTIWIIYKEWALMQSGFHRLSIIEMEVIMVIGVEIYTNLTNTLGLKKIL
jgi:hypothetical protein